MSIVFQDFYTLLDVCSERNTLRRVSIGVSSVPVTPAVLAVPVNSAVNTTSSPERVAAYILVVCVLGGLLVCTLKTCHKNIDDVIWDSTTVCAI
jgi:hypothetical protein